MLLSVIVASFDHQSEASLQAEMEKDEQVNREYISLLDQQCYSVQYQTINCLI
jgi:hypothetical protein